MRMEALTHGVSPRRLCPDAEGSRGLLTSRPARAARLFPSFARLCQAHR
jgi:hypothetical protein